MPLLSRAAFSNFPTLDRTVTNIFFSFFWAIFFRILGAFEAPFVRHQTVTRDASAPCGWAQASKRSGALLRGNALSGTRIRARTRAAQTPVVSLVRGEWCGCCEREAMAH